MTTESSNRAVRITRTADNRYTVANKRGGRLTMAGGDGPDFTPVELLLAAIGGCTAIDVDVLTSRRAQPTEFRVTVDAEKARIDGANCLTDITVTFRIRFPEGEGGDKARALLPDAVQMSHDRLCTVGVTVQRATPIEARIE
jgi:putative redox protein